jgi:hypothetical protein
VGMATRSCPIRMESGGARSGSFFSRAMPAIWGVGRPLQAA